MVLRVVVCLWYRTMMVTVVLLLCVRIVMVTVLLMLCAHVVGRRWRFIAVGVLRVLSSQYTVIVILHDHPAHPMLPLFFRPIVDTLPFCGHKKNDTNNWWGHKLREC